MQTCKGSLQDFDNIIYAYRAEIEHNGIIYKFWKEHGISRRLEKFRVLDPVNYEPFETRRYIFIDDVAKDLPDGLYYHDGWVIWMVPVSSYG